MNPPRCVRFAHITDAHVTLIRRPSATLKHRSVEVLADLLEQCRGQSVDAVLFGGDNIDNHVEGASDLRAFHSLVADGPTWAWVPGNHEVSVRGEGRLSRDEIFGAAFGVPSGCFSIAFSPVGAEPVRVIGIDTTLAGATGGYVSDEVMAFLAQALRDADEPHVLVLGHHLLHPVWAPLAMPRWDEQYLVSNRDAVSALLASHPKVRAYLCGHHHASRIQRVGGRGQSGGFFHILSPSPIAYPHAARVIEVRPDGLAVTPLRPRIPGLLEAGREAVLTGRKARRFGQMGAAGTLPEYLAGRPEDNEVFLRHSVPRSRPRRAAAGAAVAAAGVRLLKPER